MRIPQEKIEEIRSASDIVDVVAQYVRLKKRGKNFTGLCPFHQEKTPSFTVSPEKQVYHCFGCGKGGNVFTFIMDLEKVSFVEAVRSLAGRAGIVIPEGELDRESQSETEALYNACRFAGLHFHESLTKTDEGRSALEYFHGRGFQDETIRAFGLGYALNSWDALLQRAKEEGIPSDLLLKVGLVRAREDGSVYDYFRGRAMFPILSPSGRVIGFGARKLREDDPVQGKYINSPETPIYSKSRVLFGLFQAKESLRAEDSAVLVEGYADLISLHQAGIRNVVATAGTALTEEQVQLISRYTRNLLLVFDADSAGSAAMLRGLDVALEHDLDVRIAELPEGEDPDSFVRKHGGKEFRALTDSAVSFIDFKARQFVRSGSFATPEGKAAAVRSIVQSIAKMRDELKRNFYVKEVSEKYDIYELVIRRELDRWLQASRAAAARPRIAEPSRSRQAEEPLPEQAAPARTEIPTAERDILKLMLENRRDLIGFIFTHITLEDFLHPAARRLAELIFQRIEEHGSAEVSDLVQEIEDVELKGLITDLTFSRYELSRQWQRGEEIEEGDPWEVARGAITAIKKRQVQRLMEENQRRLRDAAQRGDDAIPFVQRHQELLQLLKEVESAEYLKLG